MHSLVINSSNTPIIRGGRANFVLPIFVFAGIVLWNVVQIDGAMKYFLAAFVIFWACLGIHSYVTALVKMKFSETELEVMFPLHTAQVRFDEIESIKISLYSLTPMARIRLRRKGIRFLFHITIVGVFTPWGNLKETMQKLHEEFSQRGVRSLT